LPSQKPTVIHLGSTTQSTIEAALRGLPIIDPDRSDVIPYSALIPGIARSVLLMRRPNNMKSMRKRAIADLDKIKVAAARLADLIRNQFPDEQERLSNPRIRITEFLPVGGVLETTQLLNSLAQFISMAERARDQHYEVSPRSGARKPEALAIGLYLYQEYERLTGKKPTRTVRNGKTNGRFQTLITKVFEALGIDASAEATAAKVMEKMKSR
jgi:hypothetical protein